MNTELGENNKASWTCQWLGESQQRRCQQLSNNGFRCRTTVYILWRFSERQVRLLRRIICERKPAFRGIWRALSNSSSHFRVPRLLWLSCVQKMEKRKWQLRKQTFFNTINVNYSYKTGINQLQTVCLIHSVSEYCNVAMKLRFILFLLGKIEAKWAHDSFQHGSFRRPIQY